MCWYNKMRNMLTLNYFFANPLQLEFPMLYIRKQQSKYELRCKFIDECGNILNDFAFYEKVVAHLYDVLRSEYYFDYLKSFFYSNQNAFSILKKYQEDYSKQKLNGKCIVISNEFDIIDVQKTVQETIYFIFNEINEPNCDFEKIDKEILQLEQLLDLDIKRLLPVFKVITFALYSITFEARRDLVKIDENSSFKKHNKRVAFIDKALRFWMDISATVESNKIYYKYSIWRKLIQTLQFDDNELE